MPQLQRPSRANLYLSMGSVAFALLLALVWVRYDSGSGLILKVRRQVTIGDALAPTMAAVIIGLGGILLFFQSKDADQPRLSARNTAFLLRFLLILVVGFALMRWTGPFAIWVANIITDADLTYRALRGTAPWKYLGFFIGGTFLITTLIASTEGRLTRRNTMIGVVAILALIALYDLPFDDLQLPPNGDV